jgi:hypothetical protein
MKTVMKKDVHYGVIPGTNKPTLYKPGAEALCVAFHIAPTYEVTEERFDDGVRYRVTCRGIHQGSGRTVADGLGSCSSMEEKYKWRKEPNARLWAATPPDRRRVDIGYNRGERREYDIPQVRVETADIENTLLKMACKRAMIAMVLNALAVSDIFTQDTEDLSAKVRDMVTDDEGGGDGGNGKQEKEGPRSKSGQSVNTETGEVTDKGEDKRTTTPATEGMLRLIRAKAKAAGIEEATIVAHHKLDKLEAATIALGNEIINTNIPNGVYAKAEA